LVAVVRQGLADKILFLIPQLLAHLQAVLLPLVGVMVEMLVLVAPEVLAAVQAQYLEARLEALEHQVKVTLVVLV
jgi:hypothetical protein